MIDRVEINLLPAEYRVHKKGIRIPREVVWALFGLFILFVTLFSWTISIGTEIDEKKNEIISVDDQIKKNSFIKDQITRLRKDRAVIQEKIVALERINVNREKWVRLMEIMCQKLPDFTWIVSVDEKNQTPPQLVIEGRTLSFPEVANFMSRLSESEFIRGVDLSSIEETKETVKLFKFNITCTINPDVRIETTVSTSAPSAQDSSKTIPAKPSLR